MAGILDERQLAVPAELYKLCHPTQVAAIMHDHDGLGARGDESFDMFRVDRRLIQVDNIGEYRRSPDCHRHVGGRDEIQGWLDDFVTGAELSAKKAR